MHRIRELKQEKRILQALNDYLYDDKISSQELRTILSDNLKNEISPIKAYVEILLEGHFGKINSRQKEKLKIIRSSVSNFDKNIFDKLNPSKVH